MDTKSFDYGSFWLFVKPPKPILVLAVLGLLVIGIGYVAILMKMVSGPKVVIQKPPSSISSSIGKASSSKETSFASKVVSSVVNVDTTSRKLVKLWLKIGDLAFETLLLVQVLESGSPTAIIAVYTIVVASNALTCAVLMFLPLDRMGLISTLVDLLFDLAVAVGCPMFVLVYCLSSFNFPREKLAINLEVFPAGWFEQQASVIADPVQTAVIYKILKSLRVSTVMDFFARLGVHATLFLRLRQFVHLIQNPSKQKNRVYPSRHRIAATFFAIFSVLLFVFVGQSMRTSAIACRPHPECIVNARRWTFIESGSLTQCPCLMLIDRDIAPKTFAEWQQPKNMTEKVAQLASRGDLQTLQLTNRFLPVLPDELSRCTEMRHLSLEYTHTQTLPDWIKNYTKLEFL
ncbi:10 kda heat shock protein, partial [Phytophthora boehmeriae]